MKKADIRAVVDAAPDRVVTLTHRSWPHYTYTIEVCECERDVRGLGVVHNERHAMAAKERIGTRDIETCVPATEADRQRLVDGKAMALRGAERQRLWDLCWDGAPSLGLARVVLQQQNSGALPDVAEAVDAEIVKVRAEADAKIAALIAWGDKVTAAAVELAGLEESKQ